MNDDRLSLVELLVVTHLLPGLELRLPLPELGRVLLVQLLQLERLMLHEHLPLLVLKLLQLLDGGTRGRSGLFQLAAVLRLEALLLSAVTLLLSLLEL